MSESWHSLIPQDEFPAEGKYTARINGWYVLVCRTDEGTFAVNDRCTHQASLLSTGRARRGAIMCPLHGARFDMASGGCIGGAYRSLRTFPTRTTDGVIEVCVPDAAPAANETPVVL